MILKKKFPLHPMLKEGSNQDWHVTLLTNFKKQANRARKEDPSVAEERSSEALYRTVSGDNSLTRAKYWGKPPLVLYPLLPNITLRP